MNDETTQFALTCRDGNAPAPVLVGAQVDGRLDAVLFELTLRQTYRNPSDRVLEVVYTFPLPPMAVLLGFASELNGERQEAVIVAKREAEGQYEKALAEGDAPVMLEAHSDGLHTANVGNLKPGDELILECRFAQILCFEQGRLRVAIPTTIAPRYGHAGLAGLQPQQAPQVSLDADHPLALTLTLGEALAGASLECPTHAFKTTRDANGAAQMTIAGTARLDRDVVVIVTPRETRPSLLVAAADPANPSAPVVMMAALQSPASEPRERIALKLLVDCSGSMSGDGVASARAALRGVVAGLGERDRLSLSRFGSTVEHLFAPSLAKPQALRHLVPLIDGIQADLGGTEMKEALQAVLELPGSDEPGEADVLLITDGQIWQSKALIAAARASRHRIFAIGVGSAPAEGVLRELAETTGGACDFATPGEALETAARRMLFRVRQPVFTNVRVDWGATPAWSTGPSSNLFAGDTAIALAGFSSPAQARTVRLLADDPRGKTVELARSEADAPCAGDGLPRIAAARRLAERGNAEALALALQYQLMSTQTNCILVHHRADIDKAEYQAELHRVSAMVAAGWGGTGAVMGSAMNDQLNPPAMPLFSTVGPLDACLRPSITTSRFNGHGIALKAVMLPEPASLQTLAQCVEEHFAAGGQLHDLAASSEGLRLHTDVQQALHDAVDLGLTRDQAWLLLAHWINTRANGLADANMNARLRPLVDLLDAALVEKATQVFERRLGSQPCEGRSLSRLQRLRRALGRLGT